MRRIRISPVIALVVALCLLAAAVSHSTRRGGKAELASAVVEVKTFPIEVRTTGEVESLHSIVVSNRIHTGEPGKVIQVIPDGSALAQGDLIMHLDAAGFERRLRELNGQIEIQEAELIASQGVVEAEEARQALAVQKGELETKLAQAELEKKISGDGPKEMTKRKRAMEKAERKLKNQESFSKELSQLQKEGLLSPKEVGDAKRKQKEKEEEYENAKVDYEHHLLHEYPYDKETGKLRIQMAELDREQAVSSGKLALMKAVATYQKGRLKLAELKNEREECIRNLAACEVRAPQPGTLVLAREIFSGKRRKLRLGDTVFYGQPLAEIPDSGSMAVKTKIRERDLQKVTSGIPAHITVDALPNTFLSGEVVAIGGVTEAEMANEKAFEVTVVVDGEDERLRPGMTARCILTGEKAKGHCVVPIQAVFQTSTGSYCYKKQGSSYRKVPVTVGCVGDDLVQITSGLKKGDRVALQAPPTRQILK